MVTILKLIVMIDHDMVNHARLGWFLMMVKHNKSMFNIGFDHVFDHVN